MMELNARQTRMISFCHPCSQFLRKRPQDKKSTYADPSLCHSPRSSCWKFIWKPKEFYSYFKSSSKSKLSSFWFKWKWKKFGVQSKYSKWRGLVSSMTKLQKLLRFCTIFKLVKEKIKWISLNASPTQNRGSHCKLKKRPPVTRLIVSTRSPYARRAFVRSWGE